MHFNQFAFNCSLCDKKFKYKVALKLHLANKHGMEEVTIGRRKVLQATKKFVCDVCKEEFNGESTLKAHMVKHKLYKCPECSAKRSRVDLALHRYEAHGVSIPTCGICGYKTPKQSLLVAHQRNIHMKEKNYACPECDAKFFGITHLKRHLVKHNPIKIYECRYCKKKFPRRNALRQHEKIHTGDKRKVCGICNERFVQKSSLSYHMAKHHPEAV